MIGSPAASRIAGASDLFERRWSANGCSASLGYEVLNEHDQLRHDPVMATLVGKLSAHRRDCAPLAGKSTLKRLELS